MALFSTAMDPYTFHRLALSPLVASDPLPALDAVKSAVPGTKEKEFLAFLTQNGLAPLKQLNVNQGSQLK